MKTQTLGALLIRLLGLYLTIAGLLAAIWPAVHKLTHRQIQPTAEDMNPFSEHRYDGIAHYMLGDVTSGQASEQLLLAIIAIGLGLVLIKFSKQLGKLLAKGLTEPEQG